MQTPESELPDHVQATRRHTESLEHGPDDTRAALGNEAVGKVLEATRLQRSGATSEQQLDEAVARTIQERRGRGQALDDGTREHMEDALGHDLSGVRVHADGDADELSQAVSAKAFTTGEDVFFRRGTYDPTSSQGRQLLAHELTHVVQQRAGTSGLAPGQVSDPSDASEQEAELVGRHVATPPVPDAPSGGGVSVSRQEEEPEEEEMPQVAGAWEPGIARQVEEEEELLMD